MRPPAGKWSALSCVLAMGSLTLAACFVAIPSPASDTSADASSAPNAVLASGTSIDQLDIYGAYESASTVRATTATLAADLRLDAFNQENGNSAYLMDVVFNAASTV